MTDPRKYENPFNWLKTTDTTVHIDEEQELKIDSEEEPVLFLIKEIMFIYFRIKRQNDFHGTVAKLQELEVTWKTLEKK